MIEQIINQSPIVRCLVRVQSKYKAFSYLTLLMIITMALLGFLDIDHNVSQAADSDMSATVFGTSTPPSSISIEATISGSGLTADVSLNATATTTLGVDFVEFYDGAKLVGKTDDKAAIENVFTLNLNKVGGGVHTYRAVLVGAGGEVTVSSPAAVNVAGAALPSIEIVTPVSNRIFETGEIVNLQAKVVANGGGTIQSVKFYNGSTELGIGTLSSGFYNFAWSGAGQATEYKLTAKVTTENAGVITSTPILITVAPPVSSFQIIDSDYSRPAFGNGGIGSYYVDGEDKDDSGPDPIGSDTTGSGSEANPWRSLSKAATMAPSGSTIVFRAGTYRGELNRVTISKKLTLQPYPHERVWFKGSEKLTGWTKDETTGSPTFGLWYKDFPREFNRPGGWRSENVDYSQNSLANLGDQVFVDGQPLTQVAQFDTEDFNFVPIGCGGGVVKEKTFCLHYGASLGVANDNRIYIKDDPTGKTLEATSLRDGVKFDNNAAESVVQGLGFAHYADSAVNLQARNSRIEDNVFLWNGVRGLDCRPTGGDLQNNLTYNPNVLRLSPVIINNIFSFNGRNGLGSSGAHNLRLENNIISWNNIQRFRMEWDAAGAKLMRGDDQIFRGNIIEDNLATGLWLDLTVTDALVVNNVARRNKSIGLYFEVSSGIIIASNLAEKNGAGIQINGSSNAHIYNNTLVGNSTNLAVVDSARVNNLDQNFRYRTPAETPLAINIVNAEIAAGKDWETRNVIAKNNLFADARSIMAKVNDVECKSSGQIVPAPCNHNEIDYATFNYNLYYRSTAAAPVNLVAWKPKVLSGVYERAFTSLTGTSGFRLTGSEANGKEVTRGNIFVNSAAKDYRLRTAAGYINPALGAGQVLSDASVLSRQDGTNSVADALGITPGTVVNMGALSDTVLSGNPAPAQSDLAISSLTVPTNIISGQSVNLSATFINNASVSTGVGFDYRLQIKQGNTVVQTVNGNTSALNANASRTVSVSWTPASAGNYSVEAVVDSNNEITETNESNNSKNANLTVNKITPTIIVTGGTVTYSGASQSATVTTNPTGLSGVTVTYNNSSTLPVNAGTYNVHASFPGNANYNAASAIGTLVISKATTTLTFSNLSQTYTGAAITATATTNPAGLNGVSILYNGSSNAPVNVGSYFVTASISNANYSASNVTGTLVVSKAQQSINFPEIGNRFIGDASFALNATATSGLPVSLTIVSGPATLAGNTLTLSGGTGTVILRALQNGNNNYQPAAVLERSFTVSLRRMPFPNANEPQNLPGIIEAENFDTGGEGISYHDETSINQGASSYRAGEAVDLKPTTDIGGGETIGHFAAGEWLEYTVNVTRVGTYDLMARVSSVGDARRLRVRLDNTEIGTLEIPNTGNYETFQTARLSNIAFPAGQHILRVEIPADAPDYLDLNWLQISEPVAVRIDAGNSSPYTDSTGNVWSADTGFIGGNTVDRETIEIAGTTNDRLYQTERWGLSGFAQPLANGKYIVKLHFAETYQGISAAGQRVFDVNIEGTQIENLDVFAEAGGRNRALIKYVNVTVADGTLNISFTQQTQQPFINAVEIIAGTRIEAGSTNSYTQSDGAIWSADNGAVGGNILDRGSIAIANTSNSRLYQTERYGMNQYAFDVANGIYEVRLHFAETYLPITGAGQRVFSINIEEKSITNLDVFAEAGGSNRVLVKTVLVRVKDNELNINFTQQTQLPMINAIEVITRP